METYKKPSITIAGSTLMGHVFEGDGTTFETLEAHRTSVVKEGSAKTLIPFHAVQGYRKTVGSTEVEVKEPYNCDKGGK